MDRLQLIAEIFNRPALWDLQSEQYKYRICIPLLWKEVAASMGPNVTVDECKRKWKNLRDAYRAEIKRIELRIERDILKGTYNPEKDYTSKWAYFEHMKFIKDIKRPRRKKPSSTLNSTASNDNYVDENDLDQFAELHNIDDIKFESDVASITEPFLLDKSDDTSDSQIFRGELLQKAAGQQQDAEMEEFTRQLPLNTLENNSSKTERSLKDPTTTCFRCPKRSHDQIHDSGDLGNEEQTFMKTMRLDLKRCDSDPTGNWESDYNFLISFLPQIQKMNEWQNLKFRAKMSDFIFNIMSQPISSNHTSFSPL